MSETRSADIISKLTPYQRRLRVVTLLLALLVVTMIAIGLIHPFFHRAYPDVVTETVRKALVLKLVFIAGYWSFCLLLTLGMAICAWLDLREVRRKLVAARRQMWKELSERTEVRAHGQEPH